MKLKILTIKLDYLNEIIIVNIKIGEKKVVDKNVGYDN